MEKLRFKEYRLQFIAQLRKDIIHKPLECISVIVSVLMVFISMFMTLFTTWQILRQNSQIAKITNDLSKNISDEQLRQDKIISDADDILKKRLNEIELKQAEYMKQQAEHILKMTVSMDEYTNVMKSLVWESKKQADIAKDIFALSQAN